MKKFRCDLRIHAFPLLRHKIYGEEGRNKIRSGKFKGSEAINQIEGVLKEVIVKVLVESQQEVHEPVFLPGELKGGDGDGNVFGVEVVFKEDGGV